MGCYAKKWSGGRFDDSNQILISPLTLQAFYLRVSLHDLPFLTPKLQLNTLIPKHLPSQ